MFKTYTKLVAISILVTFAALGLAACSGLQEITGEVETKREAMVQWEQTLDERIDTNREALAALPADSPLRPAIEHQIEQDLANKATAQAIQSQIDAMVNEAADPTRPETQLVGAITPYLPPGAGPVLLLGTALVGSLWRAANLKRAAKSIAESFEAAKKEDPSIFDYIDDNAEVISEVQTPTARKIVDTVQGKATSLQALNPF